LFVTTPIGATAISIKQLERLVGLLAWYSIGLPLGKPAMTSLYRLRAVNSLNKGRINIGQDVQNDLSWWRSICYASFNKPHILGMSISALRTNKLPDLWMRTDASTSTGAGGYMSLSEGGQPIEDTQLAIRWTRMELKSFIQMGISINTLEYFAVVYTVIQLGVICHNKIIHIECDNTAAVSWLLKSRSKGNRASDAIARIFTLYCMKCDIVILSTHLPGIANERADWLSRDLDLRAQDADESVSKTGTLFELLDRDKFLRKLLSSCVIEPATMHLLELPRILTRLLGTHG
jgi:hypothetical protein